MHRQTRQPRTRATTARRAPSPDRAVSRRRLLAGGAIGAAGAAAVGSRSVSAGGSLPAFVSLPAPIRVFDSRQPTDLLGGDKLEAGGIVTVQVFVGEMEYEPETVFVNLTITDTEGSGYLSVRGADFRDDAPAPTTSNINWSGPGVTLANLAVTMVGGENSIDVLCEGVGARTHVIVDLQAYVPLDLSAFT